MISQMLTGNLFIDLIVMWLWLMLYLTLFGITLIGIEKFEELMDKD